mmetsp:Transcript_4464/g.6434  ORF Transcript_4464/g.6434 Transcript_4464/m.6434 type:complete len:194 (-) Transcript_4464:89-670(-)|eukprot:CAMPEP_0194216500 /NCGR_PEP_ID=MMETSP0156-20130528/19104_1 /TAXON_ID=33649 /ORGANISM="Thalassionema nitzschioides, Strain L26-B" /LENGTH=193 /DNA_ID=CAMNT_0038945287 /DNA_START=269 /DNA_END=850 /DNA_ORIENTATION=-
MSEESKTPESDYVNMGAGAGPGGSTLKLPEGMDDPSLSQEDRDMRLALALQQQENAAVYDAHKKKHQAAKAAQTNRTARSGVVSRLAHVRGKDQGMLSVPPEYTTENAYVSGGGNGTYNAPNGVAPPEGASPQEIADFKMAAGLQKVENLSAGVATTTHKIVEEEESDKTAQNHRTGHSNYHINQKKIPFVKK